MCIFIIFIVTCCSLLLSPHLPAKLSADRWELAAPFINRPQPSVEEKVQDLYLPTPPKWLPDRKMQVRALYLYFTWIHGAVDATIEVEMNVEVLSWTDILGFGSELRNVNSFTRSKTLELNFTPIKASKSRQFWDLSKTKLTKMIVLENKCWQLFQIRLVYTQKSYINCANLFKIGLI